MREKMNTRGKPCATQRQIFARIYRTL